MCVYGYILCTEVWVHQCKNEMYTYFSAVSLVTGEITHAIGTDTEPQWPPFCQHTGPQTSLHSDATAMQAVLFRNVHTSGMGLAGR